MTKKTKTKTTSKKTARKSEKRAAKKAPKAKGGPRKCSVCGVRGHNRRSHTKAEQKAVLASRVTASRARRR